jgi:hypothetical protein
MVLMTADDTAETGSGAAQCGGATAGHLRHLLVVTFRRCS